MTLLCILQTSVTVSSAYGLDIRSLCQAAIALAGRFARIANIKKSQEACFLDQDNLEPGILSKHLEGGNNL